MVTNWTFQAGYKKCDEQTHKNIHPSLRKTSNLHRGDLIAGEHIGDILPVDNLPPVYTSTHFTIYPTLNEISATELVIQIVSMLPHIQSQKGTKALYTLANREKEEEAYAAWG